MSRESPLQRAYPLRERGMRHGAERAARNNIVPRRDPFGKLPGGAPPAAFLETKRKLEETGGGGLLEQGGSPTGGAVRRARRCRAGRDLLRALVLKRVPRGLANEISFRERRNPGIVT